MFPGFPLMIKGKEHLVPALSIKQLREGGLDLMKKTDLVARESTDGYDTMEIRSQLIHMALQRNYPTIKLDDVQDSLDLSNTVTIWMSVLGASGLGVTKDPLELGPATETKTPGTSDQSTDA